MVLVVMGGETSVVRGAFHHFLGCRGRGREPRVVAPGIGLPLATSGGGTCLRVNGLRLPSVGVEAGDLHPLCLSRFHPALPTAYDPSPCTQFHIVGHGCDGVICLLMPCLAYIVVLFTVVGEMMVGVVATLTVGTAATQTSGVSGT